MKLERFLELLQHCSGTEKTKNVRVFADKWRSGVHLIPDVLTENIACIVSLLQTQINQGNFCKKDEYLMIYNFQPIHGSESIYRWSLDMVVRPMSKVTDLKNRDGTVLHLFVGTDGSVVDESYALREMGMGGEAIVKTDKSTEKPAKTAPEEGHYGYFLDYFEPKSSCSGMMEKLLQLRLELESDIEDQEQDAQDYEIEDRLSAEKNSQKSTETKRTKDSFKKEIQREFETSASPVPVTFAFGDTRLADVSPTAVITNSLPFAQTQVFATRSGLSFGMHSSISCAV